MDKYLLCWFSIRSVGTCEIIADDCDDDPDDTNDEAVITVGYSAVNHTRRIVLCRVPY